MLYFGACYLARLYVEDQGWESVRMLATTDGVACAVHGRAETVAALHRKFREGACSQCDMEVLLRQFEEDCANGGFQWLPLSEQVVDKVVKVYSALPATVHLRSSDALHLACAACANLKQIYSNDQRVLSSACHFGLAGMNVI
jgi:predicted nucleic acid-binding protein